MPESPFKPTSSLRHRRQSSTITAAGLTMSPGSYVHDDAELRGGSDDVQAASRHLGDAVEGGRRAGERSSTDEELARIAQAMTLLSLHPTASSGALHFAHHTHTHTHTHAHAHAAPPPPRPAPWPSPEELLKESLRQSLSALHALGRIKSLVDNHQPDAEAEGEKSIAQIMGFYDRAVGEMKAAGEVLTWAQQYLAEEKKVVLERLLKG